MSPLVPGFRGRFTPRTEERAFLARVARRVEAGFLMGRPHFRSRYSVVSHSGDELVIRSDGFWTDFNLGLNDIVLRRSLDGAIEYQVKFWRWLRGCILLCGVVGTMLLLAYLLPLPESLSISAQLRNAPRGEQEIGRAFFWVSLVWWGVLWPWVLAAMHRGPAEQCLRRILEEIDASGGAAAAA